MIDLELACNCTREDIAKMSDEELVALADAVSIQVGGEPIIKAADRELAIEKKMARDLNADFLDDYDRAVAEEIGALDPVENSSDEVQAVLTDIDRKMVGRDTAVAVGIMAAALKAIATVGRRIIRDRLISIGVLNERGRAGGGIHVSASLNQPDELAMEKLAGNQTFWIGEFWSKSLSNRLAATIRRESLEQGLGRSEVGRILNGVVRSEFPGVAVPGIYRGSSESYFRMLSGTIRNHASTYGALTGLEQAGIQRYRIIAVMDERTSDECKEMNGRSFSVQTGMTQMNATILAEDPEEMKSVAGWKKVEQIKQAAGTGDARSQELGLAAAGLALPPYHASCRTVISAD